MENVTCNPYLFFEGNCREAMQFYQEVFGGDLKMRTFGEMDNNCPESLKDSIMHAYLSGGDIILMASDNPSKESLGTGKIHLALGGKSEQRLREIFEKLGKGGTVGHNLEKQMWGDIYGDLKDQYGIQWMVNISEEPCKN